MVLYGQNTVQMQIQNTIQNAIQMQISFGWVQHRSPGTTEVNDVLHIEATVYSNKVIS